MGRVTTLVVLTPGARSVVPRSDIRVAATPLIRTTRIRTTGTLTVRMVIVLIHTLHIHKLAAPAKQAHQCASGRTSMADFTAIHRALTRWVATATTTAESAPNLVKLRAHVRMRIGTAPLMDTATLEAPAFRSQTHCAARRDALPLDLSLGMGMRMAHASELRTVVMFAVIIVALVGAMITGSMRRTVTSPWPQTARAQIAAASSTTAAVGRQIAEHATSSSSNVSHSVNHQVVHNAQGGLTSASSVPMR